MTVKKLGVLANLDKSGIEPIFEQVATWAVRNGYQVVSNTDGGFNARASDGSPFGVEGQAQLADKFSDAELLITMGGDGTLLYAAQLVAEAQIPVLSVNLGSLGFHTQVSPHNLEECLSLVSNGECEIENRMMLQASLPATQESQPQQTKLALNDVVVSKSAWGHMVTLGITIDEQVVTDIAADALIISTPTGSSAYNYAAGGPVLYPDMDAFIINALCAHRMRVSPLVVPGEASIEVSLRPRRAGDSAQILTDGQPWQIIADEEILKISMAPMYLPLMVFENDFFGKLRNKLRWGGLF